MKTNTKNTPWSKFISALRKEKQNSSKRFPLFFTLLTAFGVVITYNGIHGLIEKVEWLNRNPVIPLIVGVSILLFTGTIYKKL
jgi:ATP/ADP translocase